MYVKVGEITIAVDGTNLIILKGDIHSNEILAEEKLTHKQSEAWREVVTSMEKE